MTTITELATQMSAAFEEKTRDNGETFRALRDGSPDWMRDVSRHAHNDMLPDDWRYRFIEKAVDAIAEASSAAELDDVQLEPSIYNHDLTGWLHSRTDRYAYVDEAVEEMGIEEADTITRLSCGQLQEMREVLGLVVEALRERAEDEDEG